MEGRDSGLWEASACRLRPQVAGATRLMLEMGFVLVEKALLTGR